MVLWVTPDKVLECFFSADMTCWPGEAQVYGSEFPLTQVRSLVLPLQQVWIYVNVVSVASGSLPESAIVHELDYLSAQLVRRFKISIS